MNILFIGNSYTFYNNMPLLFEKLCVQNGHDVVVNSVTHNGHKLYEFVDNNDQYTKQLDTLIEKKKFDICFLQENSTFCILDSDSFMDGVSRLIEKLSSSVGKFVLYETWGRKSGSEVLKKNKWTNESMTFEVAMAYERVARTFNMPISHVGLNFYDIYKNYKEINLYMEDLSHPSYEGSCLAALTHYVTLFGQFPEKTDGLAVPSEMISIFKKVTSAKSLKDYIEANYEQLLELVRELCRIPAPSFGEQKRAEFCKNWLDSIGAWDVYIDEANNVIFPINSNQSSNITVFTAHTDTVFPDNQPMEYREDEKRVYCPGVGDDTTSVAVLLMTARYFIENNIRPKKGVLFVCNSCEEGLGNLTGTRRLFKDFENRIEKFISFDSNINRISNTCVGSHRYEVEVRTQGGHSYHKFGRKNAISELAGIISKIYEIKVPEKENTKTTYNVGIIEGGTSVNTIAQNTKMLCEYRSNDKECLEIMCGEFTKIFDGAKSNEVEVQVVKIGDRPCAGEVDMVQQEYLTKVCTNIIESVSGIRVERVPSSTDCNIPLSVGIPAVCVGVFMGEGAHTREEFVEKESLKTGLEIAIRVASELAE